MDKNEKLTCRACKAIVFVHQICKFVTFSLPSPLSLLKLPSKTRNGVTGNGVTRNSATGFFSVLFVFFVFFLFIYLFFFFAVDRV